MIAITIIVPIYNQAKYLKKCLDSLIIQEPKNIEFLLINDGSTDNSLSIMKEYAIKDHRFRIYSQENKGVAAARQKGLDIAKLYNYVRYDNSLINKKTDENSNYINNIDCAYNYLLNNNLLEKKQLFWNEYLINAAGACFLYIPQKSHKYRNIINKLKRFFRSRNSWNEFKKRSALRTNTYIYEFYERLFSIRTVGLHGKAKHTIISILGIQIKIRKENNNGSITI